MAEQPATAAPVAGGPPLTGLVAGPGQAGKPVPTPDRLSAPFWEAARRHQLALQWCGDCRCYQHPPGPVCRRCYGTSLQFQQVSGRGSVYSFTVTHHNFVPGFEGDVPFAVALVAIDDQPDVRLLANLREVDAGRIEVGMRVQADFEDLPDGTSLPQFRPERA